ncbi:MAG: hypothetical protein ACLVML_04205 [Candidatus Gastranaerophilaceae bacterium]|nr:hypothetical protein [Christensenellales bacterium]
MKKDTESSPKERKQSELGHENRQLTEENLLVFYLQICCFDVM